VVTGGEGNHVILVLAACTKPRAIIARRLPKFLMDF
jgi:hypothetical protein